MKRSALVGSIIAVALLLLLFLLLWFFHFRFIQSTQDAYVNGNQVVVSPQLTGFVQAVYCQDTQSVEEGDLLVVLDPTDQMIALERAKETFADAIRQYVSLREKVSALQAEKEIQTIQFMRAGKDYLHRLQLVDSGAVSKEDYEHAKAAFIEAFAATTRAEHELRSTEAQIQNTTLETHPNVVRAEEALRQAVINRNRCEIYAPVKGMIARKTVQVGQSISPEDSLLLIIPFDQMWVDANFKEVQLKGVFPGLPVKIYADLYGKGVLFHGKVVALSAGTGSVFSVLPPQNATGNWIKIVQRLPVRIALNPMEVEKYPLRLGLSMHVKIDVRAPVQEIVNSAQFQTTTFSKQQEGADELVAKIFQENNSWIQNP
jgi:membrane fusion protein, multidrug efflux system